MSEMKVFEFNGKVYAVGDHLAVAYFETGNESLPDESKRYTYEIHPIITLYGNRYVIAPVWYNQGKETGLSNMQNTAQDIIYSNDHRCSSNTWTIESNDWEDIIISRIVSQDLNIVYISTCNMWNGAIEMESYVTLMVNHVDPKEFNDKCTTEVGYTEAEVYWHGGYGSNHVDSKEYEYGLIHIHE